MGNISMTGSGFKKFILILCCLIMADVAVAETESNGADAVARELRSFVPSGTSLLAAEKGDLNRDGLTDYLLVLEQQNSEEGQRLLLILLRQPDGSLKLVKQNSKVVYCAQCGGMMGDPFQGVTVGKGTFTVSHYGGSAWRWSTATTFNYSRKDKTWQLVLVEHDSFHISDPDNAENQRHTPPKHYGKIDIADYDPDTYLKKKR